MEFQMFASSHKSKVLGAVIVTDTVDVVDHMTFRDGAVRLFPNKTVFPFVSAPVSYSAVSTRVHVTSGSQPCQPGLTHLSLCFGRMLASNHRLTKLLNSLWRALVAKCVFVAKHSLTPFLLDLRTVLCLPHLLERFRRVFTAKVGLALSLPHFRTECSLSLLLPCFGGCSLAELCHFNSIIPYSSSVSNTVRCHAGGW